MNRFEKDPFWRAVDLIFEIPSIVNRSNVKEAEDGYHIQLAVPGLSKEDIKVQVKNDVLIIFHEKEQKDDNDFLFTDSFKKEYILPDDADDKNITGKLEKGILELVIPKSKKKTNERTITIN